MSKETLLNVFKTRFQSNNNNNNNNNNDDDDNNMTTIFIDMISPLHDPVTWFKITHAGWQVAQWDFQKMQLVPVHLYPPLFWKSSCATCSPACVTLYLVTGSCKGPIAPKWPRAIHKLARFFSRNPHYTHEYWAEYLYAIHTCNRPIMRSCHERSLQCPLFASLTSPQRRKPPSCCTSSHARKLISPIS